MFSQYVQNTNFVCSNISLNSVNSAWLSAKLIYIKDLDTLPQLLLESKAYYIEIKAGLRLLQTPSIISTRHYSHLAEFWICIACFRLSTNQADAVRKQVDPTPSREIP